MQAWVHGTSSPQARTELQPRRVSTTGDSSADLARFDDPFEGLEEIDESEIIRRHEANKDAIERAKGGVLMKPNKADIKPYISPANRMELMPLGYTREEALEMKAEIAIDILKKGTLVPFDGQMPLSWRDPNYGRPTEPWYQRPTARAAVVFSFIFAVVTLVSVVVTTKGTVQWLWWVGNKLPVFTWGAVHGAPVEGMRVEDDVFGPFDNGMNHEKAKPLPMSLNGDNTLNYVGPDSDATAPDSSEKPPGSSEKQSAPSEPESKPFKREGPKRKYPTFEELYYLKTNNGQMDFWY